MSEPGTAHERVVVAVSAAPGSVELIERAARIARLADGDLVGVHIQTEEGHRADASAATGSTLAARRRLLIDLGGELHEVIGGDVAEALVQFIRSERATQVVLGASHRTGGRRWWGRSVINRVLQDVGDVEVHVVRTQQEERPPGPGLVSFPMVRHRRPPVVSRRRRLLGLALGLAGVALLTITLAIVPPLGLATMMLLYLGLVIGIAFVGGTWPAVTSAVFINLALNWYFVPPLHSLDVSEREHAVSLLAFVGVSALVSLLVSQLARREAEAKRARGEAEALARVAGGLAGGDTALQEMVDHVRITFDLDAVAVLRPRDEGDWDIEASSGEPVPTRPEGSSVINLPADALLVLDGPPLSNDDHRVLQAFAVHLGVALERRRLEGEAAEAEAIAHADRLRTAILRAVSHDLRTPLASIKASATSLLQEDIDWPDEDRRDFLETIDEETDRLNSLVGNLLDMSRIESGSIAPTLGPVGLDDVVPAALASLSGARPDVVIDVADELPQVQADPALLERVVANLVANGLRHSPSDRSVRLEAAPAGDRVALRVIDHGPGVPEEDRQSMTAAFQRLGDQQADAGVGLGLAVARGFLEAMDGTLHFDDTPGGGLTAVILLPAGRPIDRPAEPTVASDVAMVQPAADELVRTVPAAPS